jgi:aminoglycoside phosphotransferase
MLPNMMTEHIRVATTVDLDNLGTCNKIKSQFFYGAASLHHKKVGILLSRIWRSGMAIAKLGRVRGACTALSTLIFQLLIVEKS